MGMRHVRHSGYVSNVEYRIPNALDEDSSGFVIDRTTKTRRVSLIDKSRLDAELGQDGVKLRVRTAIQVARRHDLVPGLGESNDRVEDRGGARSQRQRCRT